MPAPSGAVLGKLSLTALRRSLPARARLRRHWLGFLWTGLLLGGVAMAVWASVDDRFPADVTVGRWLQDHDVGGQELIDFLRDVGATTPALVTVLVMAATLAALKRPRMAVVAAAFALGFVLQWLLKELVDRPRPAMDLLEHRTTFGSSSFPSGHAMSSVITAGLVLYLSLRIAAPLWLRAGVAVWALGVGLLNPWVSVTSGVHWPSDSLGGVVWGLVVIIPGIVLLERVAAADARARAGR